MNQRCRCLYLLIVILSLLFPGYPFAQDRDQEIVQDARLEYLPILDWVESLEPASAKEEKILREISALFERLTESGWKDLFLVAKIRVLLLEESSLIQGLEQKTQRLEDILQKVDRKLQGLHFRFTSHRSELKSHNQKAVRHLKDALVFMHQWLFEYDQALKVLESGASGRFEFAKDHFQKAIDHRRRYERALDISVREMEAAAAAFDHLAGAAGLSDDSLKARSRAGEERQPPSSAPTPEKYQGKLDVIPQIVKESEPAIVKITTRDVDGRDLVQGSGFIVDPSGVVVTNYHVIEGAMSGIATLSRGSKHEILGVVALNPDLDLAVLRIKGVNFPTVKLGDSNNLAKGEKVITISSPLGLPNVVSDGIVSSLWSLKGETLIQTTAPISKGSSGGPLFNLKGDVVGITSIILTGGQNLNFAVPINYVKPLLTSKEVEVTLTMLALKGSIPEPPSRSSTPPTAGPKGPPPAPQREPSPPPSNATPDEAYKRALRAYVDHNHDLAITEFESFIARHPNTTLVPNAYYWLGESNYSAQYYVHAIKTFDIVIKQYPDSPKVASALLKQGYAYLELGAPDRAKTVLSEVITRFPKSQEAGWAKQRLNQAGLSPSPTSPRVPSPPAMVPPVITPPVVTPPRPGSSATKEDQRVEPTVSVGNTDPALAHYFVLIQDKITGNWTPPKMRQGTTASVNLALRILRSGQVRDLAVDASSGDRILDDSALRAVRLSIPLPPLPPLFKAETLSLQLRFTFVGEKS